MNVTGAFSALVTPFRNGGIDEDAYREYIEWQITQGIDGLVPCGTTGEPATLSHEEHKAVTRICLDQAKGRVPVIAGVGSNNTREAIGLARDAKEGGANAMLVITPYYNRPTQEGLFAHYKAITEAVALPTIVYNVPSRTGVNVLPATIARMHRELDGVIGIKEASGDLAQISEMLELCDSDFILLSGDDFTVLPTLALGGKGTISVASNVAPRQFAAMCAAFFAQDTEKAMRLHYELAPLCRACFLETNPVPVKTALSMMPLPRPISPDVRLPLVPLLPEHRETLRETLKAGGYLAG